MSVNKLGIILFSGFLIFATAPLMSAQSTQDQTKKQTKLGTANKETGQTTGNDQTQQSLNQSQSTTNPTFGTASEPVASSVDDVKQIQQGLADLNYNPGEINGIMTAQTQQAIREFQWLNNLPVTGIADQQTMVFLETSGAQNAQLGQTPLNSEREKPAGEVEQNRTDSYNKDHNTTTTGTYNQDQSDRDRYSKDKETKSNEHATSGKTDKDGAERVSKAATVLLELTASADRKVPNELLERAEAIAVIPHMIKGAFGIGGRYGKGVVSERAANGRWSPPAFIEIGGGSFGAQIGATATDLVLVFTDRKALDVLEKGKDLKLGVDAGIVAGPIGREAEAGTNAKLETAIYAYSRAKGLFAGVALDGAVLNMDKDMNHKVYGNSVDAKEVLNGSVAMNPTVRPFVDALERVVSKKRISQNKNSEDD